jgi:hypothetical protein
VTNQIIKNMIILKIFNKMNTQTLRKKSTMPSIKIQRE